MEYAPAPLRARGANLGIILRAPKLIRIARQYPKISLNPLLENLKTLILLSKHPKTLLGLLMNLLKRL